MVRFLRVLALQGLLPAPFWRADEHPESLPCPVELGNLGAADPEVDSCSDGSALGPSFFPARAQIDTGATTTVSVTLEETGPIINVWNFVALGLSAGCMT